ncbi:carboxymuconolactone decarboxylase family protein [Marispirochaeta sp.]|jgi:alkylhydroperoxidase/carboxymuconolactone decarboxylase family protein YurZ|uniref:carboxymuconolactone decarboxylase family protein n=1 Tax=Marispirochaeta sp. TaxID=2038653 RepID=UPI0029C97F04|nr:carboxymuconolactone decarboxylase family protein [Marispirochaeta sp.]
MSFNPLQPIEKNDKDLYAYIESGRSLSLEAGALGRMEKLLIAMALDAAHGAVNGVKSLAMQAMDEGASKAQVMEALRVAAYISGVGSVYTAAAGLQDVLK